MRKNSEKTVVGLKDLRGHTLLSFLSSSLIFIYYLRQRAKAICLNRF